MAARDKLGVILAGGRASRMGGGDKTLTMLGGRPMLAHVIDRLRPQVATLALSANGDPARFSAFGLPVLGDSVDGWPGPLAGVLAGLDWAAGEGAGAIVTAAGDTPFLPRDLVLRLSAAGGGLAMAVSADGTRHPTFGLWPVALRAKLRAALEDGVRKVSAWMEAQGAAQVVFGDAAAFFNVNTPADLEQARAMPGARA